MKTNTQNDRYDVDLSPHIPWWFHSIVILVVAAILFAIGIVTYFSFFDNPTPAYQTISYHGAAAITVGWNGKQTAYKWDGEGYIKMWERRGI